MRTNWCNERYDDLCTRQAGHGLRPFWNRRDSEMHSIPANDGNALSRFAEAELRNYMPAVTATSGKRMRELFTAL